MQSHVALHRRREIIDAQRHEPLYDAIKQVQTRLVVLGRAPERIALHSRGVLRAYMYAASARSLHSSKTIARRVLAVAPVAAVPGLEVAPVTRRDRIPRVTLRLQRWRTRLLPAPP